ncbi:glycoside hydrolase family 2 TIM barrel-domain containing protein [Mucisphaera calidilacus]|uniref:glycoside hydrolase family 2 TIM barrel-domain containing protein n=1 Tax=Mucisphaera calidilacus TaxID=2527982 RepID=UPI0011A2F9F2|nr:glycoside hydrolase family 2 TIM barrel-domain containing protein [Mucisphaera calidilacus]
MRTLQALMIALSMLLPSISAASADVELVRAESGWQLQVDGEPYRIKGAGGNHSMADLVKAGGNTVRTWGIGPTTKDYLDEAHRHGLKVVVGIWLGHTRQGFDYHDPDQTAEQLEHVRESVIRFRDHPAVLMWALGNEMEHGDGGDDPVLWQHIQDCAVLTKQLDPTHPVMTVFAEIGSNKVAMLRKHCPEIDVVGINSYGGAPSLPERFREQGGTRPYVVTEFGPLGTWEVRKDDHEMVLEPTSTQKAETYETSYTALEADTELCLGSFAFLWSHKQEATHTWFGMWLEDGSKVAAVDTMTRLWGGEEPDNLCPVIEPIEPKGDAEGQTGEILLFKLATSDPDGDELTATWTYYREADEYDTRGDYQAKPGRVDGAIMTASTTMAELRLPEQPGKYRLYVTVHDGRGAAATANIPVFVHERVAASDAPPPPQ